jgi:hypothetical protein
MKSFKECYNRKRNIVTVYQSNIEKFNALTEEEKKTQEAQELVKQLLLTEGALSMLDWVLSNKK